MKGLLGTKVGMTQVFDENGVVTPVTVIQAGPCYVTQIKTEAADGYNAIQIGFDETKPKRLSRGELGHLGKLSGEKGNARRKKDAGIPALKVLREYRVEDPESYQVGQQLTVELFEIGQAVDVTGVTKGRGFTGVVKRYGFGGGPKTHGQSDRWRAPGSIGATSGMSRVVKGMRMAGRSGGEKHTALNLEVMRIDAERNLIAVKGSVPGTKGGMVTIRPSVKN
jgi:large subunit ribosomal protein L3